MKRLCNACLFILLFIPALSVSADGPQKVKIIERYVAVFDLETVGKVDRYVARPLSESIRREFVRSGRYDVIDRGNMDKILVEQKFQLSGCISGQCVVEAGQLLGVGKIVTGTVSLVGKTYYLSLSIVNVESGKIEDVAEQECRCEIDELIQSSKDLVHKLLGEKGKAGGKADATKPPGPAYTDPTTGMEFVLVKGGCFEMGDTFDDGYSAEKPVHEVCVDDFYIGKYEVTQGQWKAVMGENPSTFQQCGSHCPVDSVDWNEAQDFAMELSRRTNQKYRLPTEVEWEYAARSGGKREKYAGFSDPDELYKYANFCDRNCSYNWGATAQNDRFKQVAPVGSFKPNGLGIYDMTGNVCEWVYDWFDKNYYAKSPKENPTGPTSGQYRICRGGSWFKKARDLRTTCREEPSFRYDSQGLRLAISVQ